jgi:exodeoxyribonuclease VII small subunit
MPRASTPKSIQDLSYEATLAELEKALGLLEAGQTPLEEAMRLFERAQALLARCSALLEAADLKIRKLDGGTLVAFEEDAP